MASLENSSLVNDLRGSVGATTFSRNRAGKIAYARQSPIFPNTARQQQANAQIRAIVLRWQNLTNDQRQQWIHAAASPEWEQTNHIGRKYQPSGYQLFMQLNMSGAYFLLTWDTPPAKVYMPRLNLDSFSTTAVSPTHDSDIRFSGESFGTDFRMLCFTSASMSLGRTKAKKSFFRWTVNSSYSDISPSFNYKWSYQNIWGPTPNPARIFVRFELVSQLSGQRYLVGQMGNF